MNATAEITTEVSKIVAELRSSLPKGGRKQYPPAKHQITTLTELGLIEAMPRGFGYQDAAEVIRQATSGSRTDGAMNASGEGEEWSVEATALYKLLNPAPVVEETDEYALYDRDAVDDLQDVWSRDQEQAQIAAAAAQNHAEDAAYYAALERHMNIEEAAEYKNVHRLTLNAILNDAARRAAIFPSARRIGKGTRSMWQIPVAEVKAWTPRKDKRRG